MVGAPVPQRDQIGRKRRLSETLSPEKLIEQSEEAIKALKRHSDRGSCPKSLQYKARARIRADNDFKSGIKRIRNQAEQKEEPHPFHVKSNWKPPVQPSVALESYLERVKFQLAEIQISKPKNNLPPAERKALKDLKNNTEINIKKADKGTTSVFMSLADKKTEGQIQLDNIEHYRPLDESMVEETSVRVEQLITVHYRTPP